MQRAQPRAPYFDSKPLWLHFLKHIFQFVCWGFANFEVNTGLKVEISCTAAYLDTDMLLILLYGTIRSQDNVPP